MKLFRCLLKLSRLMAISSQGKERTKLAESIDCLALSGSLNQGVENGGASK